MTCTCIAIDSLNSQTVLIMILTVSMIDKLLPVLLTDSEYSDGWLCTVEFIVLVIWTTINIFLHVSLNKYVSALPYVPRIVLPLDPISYIKSQIPGICDLRFSDQSQICFRFSFLFQFRAWTDRTLRNDISTGITVEIPYRYKVTGVSNLKIKIKRKI